MQTIPDDAPERALREKLLRRTHDDLQALRHALGTRDFPTIVRLAHRLTGAAGALGLESLSATGRELEREGERHDAVAVHERLGELSDELARVAARGGH